MNKIKVLILILILVLAVNSLIYAEENNKSVELIKNKELKNLKQEIKAITVNTLNKHSGVGIAVYVDSKYLAEDISIAHGYKNKAERHPLKSNNLFRMGSLTKSFTGIAILKLIDAGKIEPDAPISRYLTIENEYFDRITVRQVLNMSSGLKDYLNNNSDFLVSYLEKNPEKKLSPEKLIEESLSRTEELIFEPGTNWHYTNTNYILLGMIIEAVTDRSYKGYIETNIIDHFNLEDTYVATTNKIPCSMARGYYDFNQDNSLEDWTKVHPSLYWSAGAVVSTVKDISNWIKLIVSNPEIQNSNNNLLFEGQKIPQKKGQYYTAGLAYEPEKLLGHTGTVIGYHTDAWHRLDLDTTVVVSANFTVNGNPTKEVKNQIISLISSYVIK